MFVGTVTTSSIAAAVWLQATRTLTADPFTDAGGGTLNWTHAARTLTADPFTDAGGGATVWTHSTRTLTSISLTGLVSAGAFINAQHSNLAANANVDLRPAAGKLREMTIGVSAGGANSTVITMYDGVQALTVYTIASGGVGGGHITGNNTVGPRISNNDGTNAATYSYGGIDWS